MKVLRQKSTFSNIFVSSKRKPILIETDRGREISKIIFRNDLYNNNIKHYSRNTVLGVVFAKRFNRTNRDLPERPVFFKRVKAIGLMYYVP